MPGPIRRARGTRLPSIVHGSSPFADEQTQAETKARAEARDDLIKNPGKLVDAGSASGSWS
jgi:hypothetical protein